MLFSESRHEHLCLYYSSSSTLYGVGAAGALVAAAAAVTLSGGSRNKMCGSDRLWTYWSVHSPPPPATLQHTVNVPLPPAAITGGPGYGGSQSLHTSTSKSQSSITPVSDETLNMECGMETSLTRCFLRSSLRKWGLQYKAKAAMVHIVSAKCKDMIQICLLATCAMWEWYFLRRLWPNDQGLVYLRRPIRARLYYNGNLKTACFADASFANSVGEPQILMVIPVCHVSNQVFPLRASRGNLFLLMAWKDFWHH